MRLVQIRVPHTEREAVLDALDEEDADYAIAEETGDRDSSLLHVPLPPGAVEPVLDRLEEAGLDEDAFTTVSELETATTPNLDQLEGRFADGPDGEIGLSYPELRTKTEEMVPSKPVFVALSVLSAVVATSGLLLDSAIVITGAMVISPLTGTVLSTGVGAVLGDRTALVTSLRDQAAGLGIAVASGAATAGVFRALSIVPGQVAVARIGQVSNFTAPTPLAITIAICAGAAGALALATDFTVSVAGVAISVAIVPAATAAGIGIVWTNPAVAVGAVTLLVVNVTLINVSAFAALTAVGYRRSSGSDFADLPAATGHTVALASVAIVGAVTVVALLVGTYHYFLFVQAVNENVNEVLSEDRYDGLALASVSVEYDPFGVLTTTRTVSVVVERPAGTSHPRLSAALYRHIARDTEGRTAVRVRFVDYRRTAPGRSTDSESLGVGASRLSRFPTLERRAPSPVR